MEPVNQVAELYCGQARDVSVNVENLGLIAAARSSKPQLAVGQDELNVGGFQKPSRFLFSGFALFISILFLGTFGSRAETFAEISGVIEFVDFPANDQFRREFTYSFVCISGTSEWRVDHNYIRNVETSYYYDGTNIYERTSVTNSPTREQISKFRSKTGLAVVPFEIARTNVTIRVTESLDGIPIGDLGVNIPWLAFCSGSYLKRQSRQIPLPIAELPYEPYAFAYSDKTEIFDDDLGLPRTVELFTAQSLIDASVMRESFRGLHDVARWKRARGTIPDGLLKFRYGVSEFTNLLGRNFPIRFHFEENAGSSTNWYPRAIGTCSVTSIRPCSAAQNIFVTNKQQVVLDQRFHDRAKGVDSILYKTTNDYVAPTDDPVLLGKFAAAIKRASLPGAKSADPAPGTNLVFTSFFAEADPQFTEYVPSSSPNNPKVREQIRAVVAFAYSNGWWEVQVRYPDAAPRRPSFDSCMTIPNGTRSYTLFAGDQRTGLTTAEVSPTRFPAPRQTLLLAAWLSLCPHPELPIIDDQRMRRFLFLPQGRSSLYNDPRNEGTYTLSFLQPGMAFLTELSIMKNAFELRVSPNAEDEILPLVAAHEIGSLDLQYKMLESTNVDGWTFPMRSTLKRFSYISGARSNTVVMTLLSAELNVTTLQIGNGNESRLARAPSTLFVTDMRVPDLPPNRGLNYLASNDQWRAISDPIIVRRTQAMRSQLQREQRGVR